jgi:hypothetical protein
LLWQQSEAWKRQDWVLGMGYASSPPVAFHIPVVGDTPLGDLDNTHTQQLNRMITSILPRAKRREAEASKS